MSKADGYGEPFTCAACKGTYRSSWTDAEADREFEKLHGHKPVPADVVRICDSCHAKLQAWLEKKFEGAKQLPLQ